MNLLGELFECEVLPWEGSLVAYGLLLGFDLDPKLLVPESAQRVQVLQNCLASVPIEWARELCAMVAMADKRVDGRSGEHVETSAATD